jgi:hypothetical protein
MPQQGFYTSIDVASSTEEPASTYSHEHRFVGTMSESEFLSRQANVNSGANKEQDQVDSNGCLEVIDTSEVPLPLQFVNDSGECDALRYKKAQLTDETVRCNTNLFHLKMQSLQKSNNKAQMNES